MVRKLFAKQPVVIERWRAGSSPASSATLKINIMNNELKASKYRKELKRINDIKRKLVFN